MPAMDTYSEVLVALRRIIRATDLHSKKLAKETGLTAAQFLALQTVADFNGATVGEIAKALNLSQATVTLLVNRMEGNGLLRRQRNDADRRKVNVLVTERGAKLLARTPAVLQDLLESRFRTLDDWEQSLILASLQRVARLLNAEDIDASPLLDVGSVEREATEESKPPSGKP